MFKIINNIIDVSASKFIPKQRSRILYPALHKLTYTNFHFFPFVIKLWNSIPLSVIDSPKLDDFCIKLDNYMHNTCAL